MIKKKKSIYDTKIKMFLKCLKYKGIFSVIGAIFQQLTLFSLFSFANICTNIGKKTNANTKLSFFLNPITNIYMCIFCFIGGFSERHLGIHITIIISGLSISLGSFLLILSSSIYLDFIITILYGFGFGISMTAAVGNACRYYPNIRGLITAICGGIGGNLGSALCNFMNSIYGENCDKYLKFHIIFMISGSLISIIFIIVYKEEQNQKAINSNSNNVESDNENNNGDVDRENELTNSNEERNNENKNLEIPLSVILLHSRVYYILLLFFCCCFVQGFIMTVGFEFGVNIVNNINHSKMGIIFTIMSLTGCIAGPIWGHIHDKLQFQKTLMLVNILSMINSSLIIFTKKHFVAYGFSIVINGNLNTGTFAMIFPHISRVFGFKYAGDLYAVVVFSTGISTLIGSVILYIIYTSLNSCIIVFFIGAGLNIIGFVLCFFENDDIFKA